jgi:hypothetical protein
MIYRNPVGLWLVTEPFSALHDLTLLVPPFLCHLLQRGAQHVHVGISVKLPRTRWWEEFRCCVCCDKGPQIGYISEEGNFFESYARAVKNNFLLNSTWPWKIRAVHTLNEHQDRILHGMESNHWNPLLDLSLEELYETIVLNKKEGDTESGKNETSNSNDVYHQMPSMV